MPWRIGLSPYLNARPLAQGLLGRPGVELVQASPARLCDLLRQGWLDACLASSTEYFCGGYRIIPHGAISIGGPGADALLVGNVPLAHMRTIAMSHASRSTNLLLRLVLHWLAPGRAVTFHLRPEDTLRSLHEADGCLLIGDAALELGAVKAEFRYNLGDLWLQHTGGQPLPLSCWLTRADANPELAELIQAAAVEGAGQLPALAAEAAARMHLPERALLDYLSRSLDYTWTERHAQSLRRFAEELHAIGALKQVRELSYLGGAQAPAEPVSNHAT